MELYVEKLIKSALPENQGFRKHFVFCFRLDYFLLWFSTLLPDDKLDSVGPGVCHLKHIIRYKSKRPFLYPAGRITGYPVLSGLLEAWKNCVFFVRVCAPPIRMFFLLQNVRYFRKKKTWNEVWRCQIENKVQILPIYMDFRLPPNNATDLFLFIPFHLFLNTLVFFILSTCNGDDCENKFLLTVYINWLDWNTCMKIWIRFYVSFRLRST